MKRFLKRKWHRIPVGIVAVLMALVLVAGSAFAAYTVLTGTVEVNVGEAIRFVPEDPFLPSDPDDTVVWDGNTATVSGLVAGEWIVFGGCVFNDSTAALDVTVTMTKTSGNTTWITGGVDDYNALIAGDPAPVESVMFMQQHAGGTTYGNPIVCPLAGCPLGGNPDFTKVNIVLWAGTDIVPDDYTFDLTIQR